MIPVAVLLGTIVGLIATRRWAPIAVVAIALGWGLVVGTSERSFILCSSVVQRSPC